MSKVPSGANPLHRIVATGHAKKTARKAPGTTATSRTVGAEGQAPMSVDRSSQRTTMSVHSSIHASRLASMSDAGTLSGSAGMTLN